MEFQENYPVDKLIPYARNSRTHNDEQIAQIVASIKEFGFTNPILIGADDVIIAGHGRLLAAQRMGLKEVPVVRLPHLTETQRRALVIADNKIMSETDIETVYNLYSNYQDVIEKCRKCIFIRYMKLCCN